MSIVLGIVVGIAIIVLISYFIWLKRTNYLLDGLKAINGPNIYPFIGGILEFLPAKKAISKIDKLHGKYGKTFKMAFPYTVGVFTKDVDFIEYILTSPHCIDKSYLYRFIRDAIGDNLLVSNSDKWYKRRKMITPAFHFKLLEEFVEVFSRNEVVLIEQLEIAVAKQEAIDVSHFVALCTFDNINETAMGTRLNVQLNEHIDFVNAAASLNQLGYERVFSLYKCFDMLYRHTKEAQYGLKCLSIVHNYCMSVIDTRRDMLLNNENKEDKMAADGSLDDVGIKRRTAFLDLLFQSTIDGQPLSIQDILDEVIIFMVAGYDTVSAAVSLTLHSIAQYPKVQENIIEEQRQIYRNEPTRNTTMDDIKSMTYLDMVIKESMRLYPPVPVIGRVAMEDFHYRNLHVRKGTELIIPMYALHNDPDIYSEPELFDPERFTPENQSKRNAFTYLPFSAGKRNCIGQKFGMLEMKSIVSRVLRHFEISATTSEHTLVLESGIVLHPANGVYINMKKRVW